MSSLARPLNLFSTEGCIEIGVALMKQPTAARAFLVAIDGSELIKEARRRERHR